MSKSKLYQKLARAKGNFERVLKSSDNPFFKSKYASLNDLMEAVVPALTTEGLLLLQPVERDQVTTMIVDTETGESVSSSVTIPGNINDPQKIGAAITYFRRFGLQSLLSVAAEDDDGETATGRGKYAPKAATVPAPKVETAPAPAATEQHSYKKKLGSNSTSNGVAKSNPWDGA